MLYFKTNSLVPGMGLARDIHFYANNLNKMIELKKNSCLTEIDIEAFKVSDIAGVFIDFIPDEIEIIPTINEKTKLSAVLEIQDLARNFAVSPDNMHNKHIEVLDETSSVIITQTLGKNDIPINIHNLKKLDDYTYYHSVSVACIALGIGIELGLDNKTLQELVLSALLHDIGKINIPAQIMNKPAYLTKDEFEIVKKHSFIAGIHMLKRNLISDATFSAIISHHEKWNGTGYPNRLSGTNIPLLARILSVADVYDALTSQRPYRTSSQPSDAVEYIMGGAGTFFDIEIVKAFLHRFAPYPIGVKVILNNGEIATVVQNHIEQPLRPIVKLKGRSEFYDLYNDYNRQNLVIKNTIL